MGGKLIEKFHKNASWSKVRQLKEVAVLKLAALLKTDGSSVKDILPNRRRPAENNILQLEFYPIAVLKRP